MVFIFYSEVGGRTMFRLLCRDAGGETEQMMLNETVPQWVVEITVEVSIDQPSISFSFNFSLILITLLISNHIEYIIPTDLFECVTMVTNPTITRFPIKSCLLPLFRKTCRNSTKFHFSFNPTLLPESNH